MTPFPLQNKGEISTQSSPCTTAGKVEGKTEDNDKSMAFT